MKATQKGKLQVLPDAYITIPVSGGSSYTVKLRSLPEISDSKQSVYNNEPIIGRSIPLYTFSHSGDRQIHMQLHFYVTEVPDIDRNLNDMRAIQSALYPSPGENGAPVQPPPICTIRCGQLLAKYDPLCVVLQSYSLKFDASVTWDEDTYCPYKFDMDTSWLVVYTSSDLPFQSRIVQLGR